MSFAAQEAMISFCGNVGLWVGSFTGGVIADSKGPRLAMIGGGLLFLCGYGGMHLALARVVSMDTYIGPVCSSEYSGHSW